MPGLYNPLEVSSGGFLYMRYRVRIFHSILLLLMLGCAPDSSGVPAGDSLIGRGSVKPCGASSGCAGVQQRENEPIWWPGVELLGTATMRLSIPQHVGEEEVREEGRASLMMMMREGVCATWKLRTAIPNTEETEFNFDGCIDKDGIFEATSDGIVLRINRFGEITGSGTRKGYGYLLRGNVSKTQMQLNVDLNKSDANAGDVPDGTFIAFDYQLSSGEVSSTAKDKVGAECRVIEWEYRHVASFDGGPMQMIRVPVCHDD